MLKGSAWKKGGVNPLDNLKVQELRVEVSARGGVSVGLKKPQLEKCFNEMRKGIGKPTSFTSAKSTRRPQKPEFAIL